MSSEKQKIVDQLCDSLKENSNHRKIIKMSIGRFLDALQKGEIEIKSISDFEKLIKLDLILKEEEIKNLTQISNMSSTLKRVK